MIGSATMLAAVGLILMPNLFPGFLLYGVLGSVIAQRWLVATGIVMLRRARVPPLSGMYLNRFTVNLSSHEEFCAVVSTPGGHCGRCIERNPCLGVHVC